MAHPIVFVAQMPPMPAGSSLNDVFTNHLADPTAAPRGSDLYIRYPDGSIKNLTAAAGWGCTQAICATPGNPSQPGYPLAQDPKGNFGGIAVRDPEPHWGAQKVVFSMVVGGPGRFQVHGWRWQLYEVTGLGSNETPVITRVPNQPADYNNVQPSYLSDGRILFTSDRPRGGVAHLYPQHDEYESFPIVTGVHALDPTTGGLVMLTHSPSGDFQPRVIQDGRIVFTRWDHLIRDQQADADLFAGTSFGTFTYASEAADAVRMPINGLHEIFPEPRQQAYINALYPGSNWVPHAMNLFMPWEVLQDGTKLETLNHWGRHEQLGFFERSFNDDPALVAFNFQAPLRPNQHALDNLQDLRERPSSPNSFVAVRTVEFAGRGAGQLVSLTQAQIGQSPTQMRTGAMTHPNTYGFRGENDPPRPGDTGRYRDPAPLADGRLIAAHSLETRAEVSQSNSTTEIINGQSVSVWSPSNRYEFRLRLVTGTAGEMAASGAFLTPTDGIRKTIAFWRPDDLVRYNNVRLWEMDPVELRVRTPPPNTSAPTLATPEAAVFSQEQVDPAVFRQWLIDRKLAVIVVRNNTRRDKVDRQQPFNLQVPGGAQTLSPTPPGARLYAIDKLQVFQGDQVRGKGGMVNPRPGRRVLARRLHQQPFGALEAAGFPGAFPIAPDGSSAVVVPAERALTWQTLAPNGAPVVRERVWLSLQPGEIRTCEGCHGVNELDQAGQPPASNQPEALRQLLRHWKLGSGFAVGGTLTGLAFGQAVVLHNATTAENLTRTSNGAYSFSTAQATGASYNVTVQTQPTGQTCTVANGSGTIGSANVTNVNVTCTTNTYTVGGSISGLSTGLSVVLRNATTGENLSRNANGAYSFASAQATGATYTVTVQTQPTGQTCTVANGSGTIGSANISNINVTCHTLGSLSSNPAAGTTLDFGSVVHGQDRELSITLSNGAVAGATTFAITGCTLNGAGYSRVDTLSFPQSLSPGGSIVLRVRLTASAALTNPVTSMLRCTHSAPGGSISWPLIGRSVMESVFGDSFEG